MTAKRQIVDKKLSPSPKEKIPRWEMRQDDDGCDPDKLFLCPYDPKHKIRACRFPYHLVKCRQNHPQLASELQTCPFNACHIMPKRELSEHMGTCVNRSSIDIDYVKNAEAHCKFKVPVSTWNIPAFDEDWDLGEEKSAEPGESFDWGVSTSGLSQDRAQPATINSVTLGVRAPRVLPWKMDM